MDHEDRAYVVGLAEEVFGTATRGHRWPFLVDEEGVVLEPDAFWPEHGVALALLGDDAMRWHYAPFALNLRDVRLLLVDEAGLPTDAVGRVVRDPALVRLALVTFGFPASRAAFEELVGETDGARASGRPGGPGDEGGSSAGPVGGGSGWETFYVSGGDDPEDAGSEWVIDSGDPGATTEEDDDEPWLPDWRYEADADESWSDDDEVLDPYADDDAVLELGWRSRPIALAALDAAVLARRTLADRMVGGADPTTVQVLVALAVPEDEHTPAETSTVRGVAARLALGEHVARAVLEELVAERLARRTDDPVDAKFELTPAGRDAVRAWLGRISPLFAGWPVAGTGVDDAA